MALLVGLCSVLLTATPVAAAPSERDNGHGPPCQGGGGGRAWGRDGRDCGSDRGAWGGGDRGDSWDHGRRGVFQDRRDGLSDDQADTLSDVLQDCVSTGNLRDLRWWQLRQLVEAIGLSDDDRRHIRSLADLSDALAGRLEDGDLQHLKVSQILQVGHACGLSTRDVLNMILDL